MEPNGTVVVVPRRFVRRNVTFKEADVRQKKVSTSIQFIKHRAAAWEEQIHILLLIFIILVGLAMALASVLRTQSTFTSYPSFLYHVTVTSIAIMACVTVIGVIGVTGKRRVPTAGLEMLRRQLEATEEQVAEEEEGEETNSSAHQPRQQQRFAAVGAANVARGNDEATIPNGVSNAFRAIDTRDSLSSSLSRQQASLSVLETQPYYYDKTGVNLLFRLGLLAFMFGTTILVVIVSLNFDQTTASPGMCWTITVKVKDGGLFALCLVFYYLQTYIVFRYHKIVFRSCSSLIRLCLIWMIAGNITHLLYMMINAGVDVFTENRNSAENGLGEILFKRNTSRHCEQRMGQLLTVAASTYSLVIQYQLLAASVMFTLYRKVGKQPFKQLFRRHGSFSDAQSQRPHSSVRSRQSYAGFFLGSFLGLAYILQLILRSAIGNKFQFFFGVRVSYQFALIQIIYFLSACLSISLLLRISNRFEYVHFNRESIKFRLRILTIGTVSVVFYQYFDIISSSWYLGSKAITTGDFVRGYVELADGILPLVHVVFQTLFIMDALYRRVSNEHQGQTKPGRNTITLLAAANLVIWIDYSIDFKAISATHAPFAVDYLGQLAWALITCITRPLSTFYYFHCFVTLAEIWKSVYIQD